LLGCYAVFQKSFGDGSLSHNVLIEHVTRTRDRICVSPSFSPHSSHSFDSTAAQLQ
jgi:hypothetical protein